MVGGGRREPSGRESVPIAVLHQLQPEEGLVHHLATNLDSELGSREWQHVDRSVWRRLGKNYEAWESAGVADRTILRERGSSARNSCVEYAAANCVFVSKVKQARKRDVAGEKAETVGSAATTAPQQLNLRASAVSPLILCNGTLCRTRVGAL